jgi:putative endonuclease
MSFPRKRESSVHYGEAIFVYVLAGKRNGTLYVGVTSKVVQRVWQHKQGAVDGLTKQHNVARLVDFEGHDAAESAGAGERQIQKWIGSEP